MKTGIKFKPCNVGTAEVHNRRDRAYCEAIAQKYGHTYFWEEYRHLNQSWRNPSYPKILRELLEEMKVLVKQKTGRSMQCKPVEVKDRKTGKKITRSGCSAIREGCPPIKPDTQIEDFFPFIHWLEKYGIKVISIDLHHDEGHPDPETDDLLPNHHAHIIVDWLNHKTGKTVKINQEVCKQMQTVLAESLGMERGTPKEDSGIEGLSAIEYKEKMAAEHVRKLKHERRMLEIRKSEQIMEQASREFEIAKLETMRIEKHKVLDAENGSALKSGLANIFGKGKYAEMERENARLKSEIELAETERANSLAMVREMEQQVSQIPVLAEQRALDTIKRIEAKHEMEIRQLREYHKSHVQSLQSDYAKLSDKYCEFQKSYEDKIERLEREKKEFTSRIKSMYEMLNSTLREAVIALIEFSRSVLREFSIRHLEPIMECLSISPNNRNVVSTIKLFARPLLNDCQYAKGSKELDRVCDIFPSILKDMSSTRGRGARL